VEWYWQGKANWTSANWFTTNPTWTVLCGERPGNKPTTMARPVLFYKSVRKKRKQELHASSCIPRSSAAVCYKESVHRCRKKWRQKWKVCSVPHWLFISPSTDSAGRYFGEMSCLEWIKLDTNKLERRWKACKRNTQGGGSLVETGVEKGWLLRNMKCTHCVTILARSLPYIRLCWEIVLLVQTLI
jgi:hypothetical protein